MICEAEYYRQFEAELISQQRFTHAQALAIYESLWQEGIELGVLPPKDPMEGIEADLRLAAVINSCSKSCSPA